MWRPEPVEARKRSFRTNYGRTRPLSTQEIKDAELDRTLGEWWRMRCKFCRRSTNYVPGEATTFEWCCVRAQSANSEPPPKPKARKWRWGR